MKLYISRDQSEQKGLFGGSKGFSFSLSCRLELTEDEKQIIDKYKQWDIPVYSYATTKGTEASWSLRELTTGRTVNCSGVAALLSDEEEIKNACANIQVLLDVMESFGGEEVIEF